MLIHEMGHAIRETQDDFFTPEDFEAICGQDPRAKEMLSSWLEELYEDLVATHLLGPAYLASFAGVGHPGWLKKARLKAPRIPTLTPASACTPCIHAKQTRRSLLVRLSRLIRTKQRPSGAILLAL